jgi:hypothetical protein
MVLRDSFLASEKVKIVMLTCICPGMSSANHTLNSLRYAERLKEKYPMMSRQQSKTMQSQEQIKEELRLFMEKHGVSKEEEDEDMENQVNDNFKMFYQDERMDDIIADQEMLLNEEENDLLKDNLMEDDIAMH